MHALYGGALVIFRWVALVVALAIVAVKVEAQSQQYQRPKKNIVNKKEETKDQKKDGYKVDLSDIEKKYWAPKDTDFSVVQSRTYTKEKRFSVSLNYGPVISDVYNKGNNLGLTLNYFLNERHGFGLHYIQADWHNTKAIDAFRNQVGLTGGVEPDRGRMDNYIGISYSWVPIYAKMSLLGQKILYFDMAISPTLGVISYDKLSEVGNQSASSVAYGFDITQYYFLNRHWALRVDWKNFWYTEERFTYKAAVPISDQNSNTSMFLFGATYYF